MPPHIVPSCFCKTKNLARLPDRYQTDTHFLLEKIYDFPVELSGLKVLKAHLSSQHKNLWSTVLENVIASLVIHNDITLDKQIAVLDDEEKLRALQVVFETKKIVDKTVKHAQAKTRQKENNQEFLTSDDCKNISNEVTASFVINIFPSGFGSLPENLKYVKKVASIALKAAPFNFDKMSRELQKLPEFTYQNNKKVQEVPTNAVI